MRFALVLLIIWASATACADDSWYQFRGPGGDGVATAKRVPIEWSEESNLRWKTPVPGVAWSSPVFVDQLIWMTTAIVESLSESEAAKIIEDRYGDHLVKESLVLVGAVHFHALAVDADSGKLVHNIELFSIDQPVAVHSLNSYASPTPIIANGRLYCHFGSFGTVCLETDTLSVLWQTRLPLNESVGPGSSPALWENRLIIPCDGTDQQYIAALDIDTGKIAWRTNRPPMEGDEGEFHKSFSTPLIIDHDGQTQAVVVGAQWVCGYEPNTGKELWRILHGRGFSVTPRPVYGHGLIYICTGFNGKGLLAIDPSGSGDVSDSHMRWQYNSQVPTMPSPVLVGDEIYLISERGIASCVDALSGELHWRERLGGNFCASPIYAGGHVYFFGRDGRTHIIVPGTEFKLASLNELEDAIMASPAVHQDDLLIRTESHLYRIGE